MYASSPSVHRHNHKISLANMNLEAQQMLRLWGHRFRVTEEGVHATDYIMVCLGAATPRFLRVADRPGSLYPGIQ
jgi:hypothetical protein